MNFVFVFALPWVLFGLAYAAYRAARSLLLAADNWLRKKRASKEKDNA